MQLLVDIGNTRIKWAFVNDNGLLPSEAMNHADWLTLLENSNWLIKQQVSEVIIASVANDSLIKKITAYAKQNWQCHSRRLSTEAAWQQLKNGYTSVEQMGVDRWLAMIAAWALKKEANKKKTDGACLVIDCGTAITVDAIDENGQHLGGHIVPGLDLLRQTLIKQTAAVRPESKTDNNLKTSYANDTTGAVNHGSLSMVVDYLQNSWQRFQQQYPTATLFISGGNGALISELLGEEEAYTKELVLQGMSLVVDEQQKQNNNSEDDG